MIKIKKISKKILTLIILLMIIAMILLLQISTAKYRMTNNFSKSMEIATPIFTVEGEDTSKINAINNIGYYEFTIKNFNETKVSETGFLYTIEIISDTDESVKFELFNEEEQIQLENLKTQKLAISGNEKIEQKYKLKVTYDNTLGTKGKDILEEVQVKVHSEQIG